MLEALARPGNFKEGAEAAAAVAAEGKRRDVGLFLQNVIKGRKPSRRKAELLLPPLSPSWSSLEPLSRQATFQWKPFEGSRVRFRDQIVPFTCTLK